MVKFFTGLMQLGLSVALVEELMSETQLSQSGMREQVDHDVEQVVQALRFTYCFPTSQGSTEMWLLSLSL